MFKACIVEVEVKAKGEGSSQADEGCLPGLVGLKDLQEQLTGIIWPGGQKQKLSWK